jgi:hypothetical protein
LVVTVKIEQRMITKEKIIREVEGILDFGVGFYFCSDDKW